jgi:acetyl esterase/lipase
MDAGMSSPPEAHSMKRVIFCLSAVLFLGAGLLPGQATEDVKVEPDVVYGHKDGLALTFDVIRPARPNGAGVLWLQSGGWYSSWVDSKIWPGICKPYLDKGFTMFIVRHGSAPKYTVPEAIEDVRRCVRVIRTKARDFGVDPERLGVFGASAGGHLSLMLGTTGDDGDPKAKDEVLKQSSRVAAVVAICPPTDLRGWVTDPPAAIKAIPGLKPPLTFDAKKEPDCSPLLKATDKTAPTLLIHGDKDALVPIEHSKKMLEALEKTGVDSKLVVVPGGGHSFTPKQNSEIVLPAMLSWFEKQLAAKKAK